MSASRLSTSLHQPLFDATRVLCPPAPVTASTAALPIFRGRHSGLVTGRTSSRTQTILQNTWTTQALSLQVQRLLNEVLFTQTGATHSSRGPSRLRAKSKLRRRDSNTCRTGNGNYSGCSSVFFFWQSRIRRLRSLCQIKAKERFMFPVAST